MKKRVGKKKRLGEFREFGFKADFRFPKQLDPEARNELLNRFIRDVIEGTGLRFGDGGGENERQERW